jgi:hypothetical protein
MVIFYANGWKISIREPTGIRLLHSILYARERDTVAKVNKGKAKDLLLGKWNISFDILDIPYITEKKDFRNAVTTQLQPKIYSVKCLVHEGDIIDFRTLQRIRTAHIYLRSRPGKARKYCSYWRTIHIISTDL